MPRFERRRAPPVLDPRKAKGEWAHHQGVGAYCNTGEQKLGRVIRGPCNPMEPRAPAPSSNTPSLPAHKAFHFFLADLTHSWKFNNRTSLNKCFRPHFVPKMNLKRFYNLCYRDVEIYISIFDLSSPRNDLLLHTPTPNLF